MNNNLTDPSNLKTLDDQSLEVLIQHYLSVQHRLPDNITVRERLLELEREQFEREKEQFHQRVREGYLTLARQDKKRFRVIDASRSLDEVEMDIAEHIRQFIDKKGSK